MKLMKSFLTLLLLGGMTFAGCNKKDQTPSGEEGGGGSGGDGGGVVDRFTNKRFDFESSDNAEIEAQYQGTYCSFFTEGDFEVVLGSYVATGDYTLSADKQSATMVMKGNKTAEGSFPLPEQYWSTMPVEYVAATSKYVVTVTEEEMTAHLYYVLSSEAPVHYVFPQVQKVAVTFDANATDATGSTAAIQATPNEPFYLPECGFEREGYEFQGWSLTTTGEQLLDPHSFYTANAATTFYAIWEAVQPTDYFTDKKIVTESLTVDPDTYQEAAEESLLGSYLGLFENGEVQMAYGEPGHRFAQIGTFTIKNELEAEIQITALWSEEYEGMNNIPESAQEHYKYSISYNKGTEKYTVVMYQQVGETEYATITIIAHADESAPEMIDIILPPYVLFGKVGGTDPWQKAVFVADPVEDHEEQVKCEVSLEANDEFVVYIGSNTYLHYEQYTGDQKDAGYMVVQGAGENEAHNFKVLEDGVYTVYKNNNGLSVGHARGEETQVEYTFEFVDTWDVTAGGAEFYAWVWGANNQGGHWIALTLDTTGEHPVAHFETSSYMYFVKVVRVNPSAAHKPVADATEYGEGVDDELWNWTGDFRLSGVGGTNSVWLDHSHE